MIIEIGNTFHNWQGQITTDATGHISPEEAARIRKDYWHPTGCLCQADWARYPDGTPCELLEDPSGALWVQAIPS